ncbi:MAG: hypothetical protein ACTSO7_04280 [Candidatus Heimdallarchaeota archaeon]
MPTTLDKELAYLAGMVNGDGHLEKYFLHIVDYSIKNITQLQTKFQDYFAQIGNISHKRKNSPELVITNLWVVRFFSFLTSQPIGGKKYGQLTEPLILLEEPFRSYYWSGVMDSDGSYKNRHVTLCSASEDYILSFISYLSVKGIKATFRRRKDNTFVAYIPSRFHKLILQNLVCKHPEKQGEFLQLEQSGSLSEKYFEKFNQATLHGDYFDLQLIDRISIVGLEGFVKQKRGLEKRTNFARKIGVNYHKIIDIELRKQNLTLDVLSALFPSKEALLNFLSKNQRSIRFKLINAHPVKIELFPTNYFTQLSLQLKYYKNSITIPNKNISLKEKLEDYFDIIISNYKITNRFILRFYQTFGLFTI